MKKELIESVAA